MEFCRVLKTCLDIVDTVIADLLKELNQFSFEENDVFHIKLCVQEALINAMRHGNKLDENLSVILKASLYGNTLSISVQDQGLGFDYSYVEDPTQGKNIERASGRGIFLIRSYMDQVDFFDRGRGIKMIKFLKKV